MTKAHNTTMEETKLTRTGQRPLVFMGEELASDSTKDHNSTRWQKCEVHKTDKGKFVLGLGSITCWQGETDHYSAYVFDTAEDLITKLEEEAPRLVEEIAAKLNVSERL